MLPSELMSWTNRNPDAIVGPIAYDTETSGLFADSGARVSTVSVAFQVKPDREHLLGQAVEAYEIHPGPDGVALIASFAWPFDQGVEGKPEQNDQPSLFPEADNLPLGEWRVLLDWIRLAALQRGLTTHNRKFDHEKIRVGCRRWPGEGVDLTLVAHPDDWDTQNVCNLLWPLEKTSLKPTASRVFGIDADDEAEKVKKYLRKQKLPAGRWDLMPWSVIGRYATKDAVLTKMLELRQKWEIEQRKGTFGGAQWLGPVGAVGQAVQRRMTTTDVLYRMERRGLPYDEQGSLAAAAECMVRAKRIGDALPFPPSINNAKAYFFGKGKTLRGATCCELVPYETTGTGAVSMTAGVLARMVEDQVPWAGKWAEYCKITNAASMWYTAYAEAIGPDGRLRTCFRQNGTVSTRFSVERVNLQAIPQDYRLEGYGALDGIPTPRQLIANAVPRGWRIYELDLAQAELRVGAQFAGCTSMLAMIESNQDLHAHTTASLFPQIEQGSPEWFQYRQVGKRANFSLMFRAQGPTFAKMVAKETGIRLEAWEADKIVRDWNMLYPEFARANAKHESVVANRQSNYGRGWVEMTNRERRWYGKWDDCSSAFNQRVQGNLAQFGNSWMIDTDRRLSEIGRLHQMAAADGIGEVGLVLTIHDSQVLLLPDSEEGRDWAAQCATLGQTLWEDTFSVPGGVDFHPWSASADGTEGGE